jgi:hypothetical protein
MPWPYRESKLGNEIQKDKVLDRGVFRILVRKNNQDSRAVLWKNSTLQKLVSQLPLYSKILQGKQLVEENLPC